jgi:glucose/arabinose dehydrogenase
VRLARSIVVLVVAVLVAALVASACGAPATDGSSTTATTAPADGLTDIGDGLRGPAGLHATTYATGLMDAAALAVDAQGRVWVATAAYKDVGTDAVYLVPAPGASPIKVLADQHTPLGLWWDHDTLYVASKETVQAYTGFDGTAFADHHEVVAFPADSGENNGLVLGPDGRFHLGISAPCDSCTPSLDLSGSVVSFLPDGSDFRVDAKAIRAPVGLTFFPGTSDLFVTMNQRDDLGDATPGDLLSVVAPGQSWGFPGCYSQGGSACQGVPAPVAELDEHAAVSGVAITTGQLGSAVATAAIVAEWATGSVLRVPLAQGSATRGATPKPFVTGMTKPEPVLLAPDGGLLVGDWQTGTLYRIAP